VATASTDEYLAALDADRRLVLERIRALIRAAAPDAVEVISYGMPAFKLDGRYLVGFGATRDRCSLYTGKAPLQAVMGELAGYQVWKGTINFSADRPLPDELVMRIVRLRVAEFRGG
jgi:uncharacterized protein YdhG (YjbR/CyaY superfamily)